MGRGSVVARAQAALGEAEVSELKEPLTGMIASISSFSFSPSSALIRTGLDPGEA